jgi:hypothetical protein
MKTFFSIIFIIFSSNIILSQTTYQSSLSKGNALSKKGIDLPQTVIKYPYYDNANSIWLQPEATYYTYDYSGNKTSELFYNNENLYKYFYNAQGLLTTWITFSKSRTDLLFDSSSIYIYTYDSLNNITTSKQRNCKNSYFWPGIKYINSYNEKKQLIKVITEDFDYVKNVFKIYTIENFIYDSLGRIIEVNIVDTNNVGNILSRKHYKWFEWNGKISNSKISMLISQLNNKNDNRMNNSYDSFGNLTETIVDIWKDSIWKFNYKTNDSLKYNGNILVQKISSNWNLMTNSIRYFDKYVYSDFVTFNVGIKEQTKDANLLNIYPNPSSGNFNIESNKDRISYVNIYNLTGTLVYSIVCFNKNIRIDLSEMKNGVYFVNTMMENGNIKNSKIIITK